MEELMKSLKDKQLVSSQQHNFLDHNFGGVSKCLFENQMENSQLKDKHSYCYNLETKQFAMTTHHHSPKAYEFVCNVFKVLGSIYRLWTWLFCVIMLIGKVAKTKPHMSDVVLIVDAMDLHKGTCWDQKKRCYIGRVDYCSALPESINNLATEALVFMIGGVSGHWKHPIGSFLQIRSLHLFKLSWSKIALVCYTMKSYLLLH